MTYALLINIPFSVCDIQEGFRSAIHEYPKVYVLNDLLLIGY